MYKLIAVLGPLDELLAHPTAITNNKDPTNYSHKQIILMPYIKTKKALDLIALLPHGAYTIQLSSEEMRR